MKPDISPRQKNETSVCTTALIHATETAVSELPLKRTSGVKPFISATRFAKIETPIKIKLNTAYAAGAKGIAPIMPSGNTLVSTVKIIEINAITPVVRLRIKSFLILWLSSYLILFSSSSPV